MFRIYFVTLPFEHTREHERKPAPKHAHTIKKRMNDNKNKYPFPIKDSYFCQRFGLIAGAAWSVSFLLAMWGLSSPLMGNLGTIVGLLSVMLTGRFLREYNVAVGPFSYRHAWWLSISTYGYAMLITALVQYLYFRFLDHGHMFNFMVQVLAQPEYSEMLVQASHGMSVKDIEKMMAETMLSPTNMTLTLMWYNVVLGLILSIPTALIAMRGKKNKQEK